MSRILVISPHPDDEAIGCGGSLRGHALDGDEIRVIFLTSGERGGHGLGESETLALREREAAVAAEILGIAHLEFWRQPDGRLVATGTLVERLQNTLSAWRPEIVYGIHAGEMHPDHRAAARLLNRALAALVDTVPLPQVRQFEVWTPISRPDEFVDISPQIETKIAAIRAYRSQCAVMRFDEATRGLNRYRGEMHCWPGGDYAEAFSGLRLPRRGSTAAGSLD